MEHLFAFALALASTTQSSAGPPPGGYVLVEDAGPVANHTANVIYLHRFGGQYAQGADDSRADTSSLVRGAAGRIPAYGFGDLSWNTVVDCVKRIYAPFGVHVVDVDPGQLPHIEVVVGGTSVDIGRNDNVSGLAPFTCTPLLTPVVFVFSATIGNQPERSCEVAAMEAGHALGLDHEMDCRDPMTYLPACGQKSFQDAAAPCGEQDPRTCSCGGTTQNSYRDLLARLGPRVPQAPEVAITRPADGERVLQLFTVGVTASDDGNITRVELLIDGVVAMSDTAWPFDFTAPPGLSPGEHRLEARAIDDAGLAAATAAVTIVLDEVGGDGGCSVARGRASAPWLLALALWVLVRRRRAGWP